MTDAQITPLIGFEIIVRDEGEEIEWHNPMTGETETVILCADQTIVVGRKMYMTQDTFEALKRRMENGQ